jgi:hypothetical protein
VRQKSSCRGFVGFALALAWVLTLTAPGRAESCAAGFGRFALAVEACPNVPVESVRRILGIEIGNLLLAESEGVPAGCDHLTIRCADNFAWVEVAQQGSGAPIDQLLRLDDFPGDAAPRALALVGLELLATRNSTVRDRMAAESRSAPSPVTAKASPEPRPPSAVSPKSRPPTAAAPQPGPRPSVSTRETRVGLAATFRSFLVDHGPSVWGGQAQITSTLGPVWQLAADLEVAGARREIPNLGETSALLLSTGATWGLRFGGGNLGAGLGLGGRIGMVCLSGQSADPTNVSDATVWHPWGGPMAAGSFYGGFDRLALTLGAEVGRSVFEPEGRAGGVTAIAIRGPWATVLLGATIRL